jgi:shikimate dehydrogenase
MSDAPKDYFTLEDLKKWPDCVPQFPADGVPLAVLGHPVAHSLSPAMHNAALRTLEKADRKFEKWSYFKFDIEPGKLGEALRLFAEKKFLGLNLTVPHKMLALDYIDSDAAVVDDAGAANTLMLASDTKRWRGHNTDGYGLLHALKDHSMEINSSDVILLGAGGAARAAALECLVQGCASLRILNRTKPTLGALIAHLEGSTAYDRGINLMPFDPKDPLLPKNTIVVNATSLGLKESDESPLDLKTIPRPKFVFDMIYRPPETRLLKQASEMKIPHANGLSMLVHQGAESLRNWTELESVPVDVMQRAVHFALSTTQS